MKVINTNKLTTIQKGSFHDLTTGIQISDRKYRHFVKLSKQLTFMVYG